MKEGWEYKKLGEVCNIDFGTRVVRSRDAGSIYPVYGGGGATFKMDTFNREDCMVISRFGMSEQCTRFVRGKFFLNDSGLTLSMKEKRINQAFMNWQILSLNNIIYSLGRGAAQKNLDTKALSEVMVSYPSNLSEQQSIVEYLNSAFAKIDAMKINADKALNEAKALFHASLKKMLEPKEGWEYKKLGEVCNIDFGTRVVRSRDAGSIYPVYGGGGATFKMDTFNRENCMVISRFGMSEQCTRFVKGKFFLNDSGLTLSMKEKRINQAFMNWQILSLNNIIYSLGRGAAQKNLDTKALSEVMVSYPNNLFEQQTIVATLDSLKSKVDRLQANFEKISQECDALKQAILRQVFE